MSNPETGAVSVEIAGTTYQLIIDFNAQCEIEAHFSTVERVVPFPLVRIRAESGSSLYMRGLIWGAMRRHHRDLTIVQVGELIERHGGALKLARELATLGESMEPDPKDVEALKDAGVNPRKARAGKKAGAGSISRPAVSV